MGSPGGYQINPGMYRVPDLLTEEQFKEYMVNTYGVEVEFKHRGDKPPNPARALGQSRSMGPVVEDFDVENTDPEPIRDPILRSLNERNFGTSQTVQKEAEKTTPTTKSTTTAKK
jgi:hypothetical protein